MPWTYAGVRIFTQSYVSDKDQIIARLNPLGGGTILHYFGDDDFILKINAYVVGNTDLLNLVSLTTSGVGFPLSTPYGTAGDWSLKHITSNLQSTTCQTLRTDLPEDSPVYIVDLELYDE